MDRRSHKAPMPNGYFDSPTQHQYGSTDTFYGAPNVTVQPPSVIQPSDSSRTESSSKSRKPVVRASQQTNGHKSSSRHGSSSHNDQERTRQLAGYSHDALVRHSVNKEHEALIAREKRAVDKSKAVEAKNLLSAALLQISELKQRLAREQSARQAIEQERQNAGVKTTKAILDAQMQNMKLQEESAMYKLQAENSGNELRRALDVVRQVEQERNRISDELSEARNQAREHREQNVLLTAREEGRRQGFDEGLRQGRIALQDDSEPVRKTQSPRKDTLLAQQNEELVSLRTKVTSLESELNRLHLQLGHANGERDMARGEVGNLQRENTRLTQERDRLLQDRDHAQELLRQLEQEKDLILAENEREKMQLREAERDIVEIQREDNEALRRAEDEKKRLRRDKDMELEQLRRSKEEAEVVAKRALASERERVKKLEEEIAKERDEERRERRRREKESEKEKEATATAAANAAVAAVTAALGAGTSKSSGSGRKSAMSNRSDHQRMPYLPMPPPPTRSVPPPMPASPQSFIMPSDPNVTTGGMPISMPQPSIPVIVPKPTKTPAPGQMSAAYDTPGAGMWGGDSSMGPAAMSMPQPTVGVPMSTSTPAPFFPGGSSMGQPAMSMPEPTIPGGPTSTTPQPPYQGPSSMGPAMMSMPEPAVGGPMSATSQPDYPGGSSMGPARMAMPEPGMPGPVPSITPGTSSMGPAAMMMPEPTVPGSVPMGQAGMTMPTPTVLGHSIAGSVTSATPGPGGISTMGPAKMAMPEPGAMGSSSMGPAHMTMPTPTIPGQGVAGITEPVPTVGGVGAAGGSYMGPAAMSMPTPTMSNRATPGPMSASSMGTPSMAMPQPSVMGGHSKTPSLSGRASMTPGASGGSSMGPAAMPMPEPTVRGRRGSKASRAITPGVSSMGPAAMSMPEPTVGGDTAGIGSGMSMPEPSMPTAEPLAYIPGHSSMTAGTPMPQPVIPGTTSSLTYSSGTPGPGFPQPRAGSSASQRASKRMSFGSAGSSGGVSNLALDMVQFESGGRDRDRALSIIQEDAGSIYGCSPSRANTPGPGGSNFDMGSAAPSWVTNPPLDYSRDLAPRSPSAIGYASQSFLSPNTAGPALRRTTSNASSYHITIEPPSRSPSSIGGPHGDSNMRLLSPNHSPSPLPVVGKTRQQTQPGRRGASSGQDTAPNSPTNDFSHLPPNFVPQMIVDHHGISTPISTNPLLPGMIPAGGPVIPSRFGDPYGNPVNGEPAPVIPNSVYGNPLGHDSTSPVIPPMSISANKSPFRPPIGLPSAGGMTPNAGTLDLPSSGGGLGKSVFGFDDDTAGGTAASAATTITTVGKKKKKKR